MVVIHHLLMSAGMRCQFLSQNYSNLADDILFLELILFSVYGRPSFIWCENLM